MTEITKQIIQIANKIAQIIEDKQTIKHNGGVAFNAAFVATVVVLADHPELFDRGYVVNVDTGMFPPVPDPRVGKVMAADTFEKEYMLQPARVDTVDMPLASGDTPAARTIAKQIYKKADIDSGMYDQSECWPQNSNVWHSPVDGRPHFVDEDGWISARDYMPVDGGCLIYPSNRRADSYKWSGEHAILRFKLA